MLLRELVDKVNSFCCLRPQGPPELTAISKTFDQREKVASTIPRDQGSTAVNCLYG